MRRALILVLSLVLTGAIACSPGRLAVRTTIDMALRAMPAYDRERDVEFAKAAAAGQIKLLEGLLESAPDDPDLLLALSRSYARYAYGFVELEIECNRYRDDTLAELRSIARAIDFYARARGYAVQLLRLASPEAVAALSADPSVLSEALEGVKAESAPALFWTAFAWGNELAHRPVTPQSLVGLRRTAILMNRVVKLDDRIMYGSAHLYLGYYYGRMPTRLGGDATRSERHFDRARQIASERYLPAALSRAECAFHRTGDREAYILALKEIVKTIDDSPAEYGLDNATARARAEVRLTKLDSAYVAQQD